MRRFIERFKSQGLFIKIFIVMVFSIIAVCVLTSLVTIRMSERLFVQTFSITNSKVLNQIRTGLDSFNDSIVNAATFAGQSGTVKSYLTGGELDSISSSKIFYSMSQQVKQIRSNVDVYEVAVTITGSNGRSFSTDRSYWPISTEELSRHPITKRTLEEPGRLMYQYDREKGKKAETPFLIASKALTERTNGRPYGVLYIAIREKEFRQFYEHFTSDGNDVVILDSKGGIVSSNRTDLIGQTSTDLLSYAKEIHSKQLQFKNADVLGRERILLSNYLPSYNLYLVNLIDRQFATGQIINVKSVVLICIVIVSAALAFVFLISRRLTRSLSRLVRQMSTLTEKNFGNYITVSGGYEIRELGKAFNYMLDELNEYIRQLLRTQKEQRNAELEALQRQINPHFLYNTLASIKILVQKGSKETAVDTMNALISLLQNTISNVSETITIEQEIDNMKNYVFINQVRYGQRIKVNYFISPDCLEYHVPKLIIQPFIENAFFHAFNIKTEGVIYILVSKTEHQLICEVVDNGDGMSGLSEGEFSNPKSRRQMFTGIGIENVNNRINLLYGEDYGLTISSTPGEGTKVKITLPLITQT